MTRPSLLASALLVLSVCVGAAGCGPQRPSATPASSEPSTTRPTTLIVLGKAQPPTVTIDRAGTIRLDRTTRPQPTIGGGTRAFTDWESSGRIRASGEGLEFIFGFTRLELLSTSSAVSNPMGLTLTVLNGSSSGIQLDWSAATLVYDGRTYPVLHRGVGMIDGSAPRSLITVPPGSRLEDFAYPNELTRFVGGAYARWTAENFFERLDPGKFFALHLPIRWGSAVVEYQFQFDVREP